MHTKERQRKLLAPILVTPTKPLTPSHIKAFIWFDTLYKATSILHEVSYIYNRTTYDIAYQTLAFWIYLDTEHGQGFDFTNRDECWIGEQYVAFHRQRQPVAKDQLKQYRRRVEDEGWIHPASRRVLEIWTRYYDLLNLDRPALDASRPLELSVDETVDHLAVADAVLDLRKIGGPVYLDLTDSGIPLRQIIDENGQDNYVLSTLRALLPIAGDYDSIALLCDAELDLDYLLIERTLQRLGHRAVRRTLGRVPLGGVVQSSRRGGWQDYTFDKISDRFLPHFSIEAFRLGMRLYFISSLGASAKQTFRFDLLGQCIERAEKLLAKHQQALTQVEPTSNQIPPLETLRSFAERWGGYVDPYQLTSALLSKKRPIDSTYLLEKVYL